MKHKGKPDQSRAPKGAPPSTSPTRRAPDRRDLEQFPPLPDAPTNPGSPDEPEAPIIISTGDKGRDAVCAHIASQIRRYPNLDIAGLKLDESSMDPRDSALAHAICDAVIRRWITLERLISKHCHKPLSSLDPTVRAAMLVGSAQVVILDRIPTYAAVNHAVAWAKAAGPGSGFVNAVLHRICEMVTEQREPLPPDWHARQNVVPLSDGRAVLLKDNVMPEGDERRPAAATGIPHKLFDSWAQRWSRSVALDLALHSLQTPPTIINTTHSKSSLDALSRWGGQDTFSPHSVPGHYVFTGTRSQLVDLVTPKADLWAQDPSSSSHIDQLKAALPNFSPARILDLCAGLGTKTRQLAHIFPNADILATDVDGERRSILVAQFAKHPRVITPLPVQVPELAAAQGKFDLILLDVPCSNTGVLARRPEAKYRATGTWTDELVAIQRQIISRAASVLAPGGIMLYATCSLEARENAEQLIWASKTHNLKILGAPKERLPQGSPTSSATLYADGSFTGLLQSE